MRSPALSRAHFTLFDRSSLLSFSLFLACVTSRTVPLFEQATLADPRRRRRSSHRKRNQESNIRQKIIRNRHPRVINALYPFYFSTSTFFSSFSLSFYFLLPLFLPFSLSHYLTQTASSRKDGRAAPDEIWTGDRVACVARGMHTRRLACHACRESRRKGERSSVAPRRARATVQIRLSGPLAQTEAGHSASGVWRTPVEALRAHRGSARARRRNGATTGPLRTCITTT